MKNLTILISAILIYCAMQLSAQPCLPEGITFTSQAQIDNFQTNYPGCTEIEGDVEIKDNNNTPITNLIGLNVLTSIGGYLEIRFNDALTSLSGLDNLDAGSIGELSIYNNSSLSSCDVASICDYLSAPGGSISIYNNADGCNNPAEIAMNCGIALPCLPFGNYIFYTQSEIDNFQTNYPGCTEIEGNVIIGGYDITNLNGLSVMTSIGGHLSIDYNNALTTLSGLESLTTIGGYLLIRGNDALTNLSGLEGLTSIGGDLQIGHHSDVNPSLTSLSGLENLTTIGGDFYISFNAALTSLSGLESLTSIGGDLSIGENNALTSLSGLESLTSIGGDLRMFNNDALTSLSGLESLTTIGGGLMIGDTYWLGVNPSLSSLTGLESLASIGGGLQIAHNAALTSLSGLESLTSIGGYLYIDGNYALTSLSGLDNLDAGSISELSIYDNSSLSSCDVASICDYLSAPGGSVSIYNNADGCNNPAEIAMNCGIALPCLPFGNYFFYTQSEIDNFQTNYPGCTEIEGSVIIGGYDITNLNGLSVMTSIGGNLNISGAGALTSLSGLESLESIGGDITIYSTGALTSLTGLESLTSIGGSLEIYWYDALTSLEGLESLTYIGGDFYIYHNDALTTLSGLENLASIGGDLRIYSNDALSSLTGLDNVTSIGGYLEIVNNDALTSLSGLENIEPGSISDLSIWENGSLANCDTYSICEYLLTLNGTYNIQSNAEGCNSVAEVQALCEGECLPSMTFTSQTQIDSLHANHPNCTEIKGDVMINGSDITNLNGLNVITAIWGDFNIGNNAGGCNPVLTNLAGLQNLDSIGGNLGIYGNSALTSLSGLANEISIGGDMIIENNEGLANLSGLENLISITGGLKIQYSPSLIDLTGLDNLNSIGGDLSISDNDALTSLTGLENIISVGGLYIDKNDALTSLTGLENLTTIENGGLRIGTFAAGGGNPALPNLTGLSNLNTIEGGLFIDFNPLLQTLAGLDSLSLINGTLEIRGNGDLTDLIGLYNINPDSISNLVLTQNPSLSVCAVESICDYLASPNAVVNIYNNAPGCNSPVEVMDSCFITSVNEIKLDETFTISPNPLESNTLIEYSLKNNSPVTLKILDLSGREMETLVNEVQQQGEQKVVFNTAGLKPGIYFCVLKTNIVMQTTKMIKL